MALKDKIVYSIEEGDAGACTAKILQLGYPFLCGSRSRLLAGTFSAGGKVIVAGNGGSLCDASHFAEELTGVLRKVRAPLPALVLSEPGHVSCYSERLRL